MPDSLAWIDIAMATHRVGTMLARNWNGCHYENQVCKPNMDAIDFSLGSTLAVAGVAAAVGSALMLSPIESHRQAAQVSFCVAGACIFSTGLIWGTTEMATPLVTRMVLVGILSAIAGAGTIWAVSITKAQDNNDQKTEEPIAPVPIAAPMQPPPAFGSDNTLMGVPVPQSMGSGNTFVGPTDSHGNTIIPGGTAVGKGACADPTSVAIGSGANAGACAGRKP